MYAVVSTASRLTLMSVVFKYGNVICSTLKIGKNVRLLYLHQFEERKYKICFPPKNIYINEKNNIGVVNQVGPGFLESTSL